MKFLFISPHLDDVALSASGFLNQIHGHEIQLLTVFNSFNSKLINTNMIVKKKRIHKTYNSRMLENDEFCRLTKSTPYYGNFLDAIYRVDEMGRFTYDNHNNLYNVDTPEHDSCYLDCYNFLKNFIIKSLPDLIIVPLSIGCHIDHFIVSSAVKKITSDLNLNTFYYEDFPYCNQVHPKNSYDVLSPHESHINELKINHVNLSFELFTKFNLIRIFNSQYPLLFKDDSSFLNELSFYYDKKSMKHIEKYWFPKPLSQKLVVELNHLKSLGLNHI